MSTLRTNKIAAYQMKSELTGLWSWWLSGLSNPWLSEHESARYIEVRDDAICLRQEHASDPIQVTPDNSTSLVKLCLEDDLFLIAPTDKVLNLAVSSDQIARNQNEGATLSDVFGSSLPFDQEELFFTIDQAKGELFAIPRTDLEPTLNQLNDYGLTLAGIAFKGSHDYQKLKLDSRASTTNHQKKVGSVGQYKALWVLTIGFLLTGLVSFAAWNAQSKKQSELRSQIAEIEISDINANALNAGQKEIAEIDKNLVTITNRRATSAHTILMSLVQSLPKGAQINQLILNENDLVIDGEAESATSIQAILDPLPLFSDSEFISAISKSGDNTIERFRLKLSLQDDEYE